MLNEEEEVIFRCRKCRHLLINRGNYNNKDTCCKTFAQLESVLDDNCDDSQIPQWILTCLNENEWRKGKFWCPNCNGKVGSFNFITVQKCACGRQRSPSAFLYKSRIDICLVTSSSKSTSNEQNAINHRNHVAMFKKCEDDEWTVVFASKPLKKNPSISEKTSPKQTETKSHRKSHSWTASSSSASNWLASTFADVSSHLDAAATETKQVLVETLDLAGRIASPIPSAIRKGHRKTKSWSGSIKTTLSTLWGGLFFTDKDFVGSSSATREQQLLPPVAEFHSSNSDVSLTNFNGDDLPQAPLETETSNSFQLLSTSINDSDPFYRRKRKRRNKRVSRRSRKSSTINDRLCRSVSVLSIIPDYLLCSICLDIFCLPRYCLPCRHTFCEPCLKLLAHSLPLPRNRLRTLCPLCRQIIRWTEPANEIIGILTSSYAEEHEKRIIDYDRRPSVCSLTLPGLYQLEFIRHIVRGLPESVARCLEKIWVDYTPLVTLYSFCVSLLCLLFFFTLFLPCLYFTAWLGKVFDNVTGFNEFRLSLIYQEALDVIAFVFSNGILSLASIIVIISITLYILFVM